MLAPNAFPMKENAMSATIKVFHVGTKCYKHVMNAYHDSVELHDEGDAILLVFEANAKVRNQEGRMGSFHIEYPDGQPRWVYYDTPHQTRTVLSPDLHSAEVEVSKRYIGEHCFVAAEYDVVM
jgi:hypothetical protein